MNLYEMIKKDLPEAKKKCTCNYEHSTKCFEEMTYNQCRAEIIEILKEIRVEITPEILFAPLSRTGKGYMGCVKNGKDMCSDCGTVKIIAKLMNLSNIFTSKKL